MRAAVFGLLAGLALTQPGAAQQAQPPVPTSVLIIDSDRLYQESRYGQQIRARLDADAETLKAENDRIVAALTEEERNLTLRRPSLTPEDFRKEAVDFDTKVQGIRRARDAKEVALQNDRLAAQKDFFSEVQTVVGQLMLERGATVTLDQRSVFVALTAADVTDDAIGRIDAAFVDAQPVAAPAGGDLIEGSSVVGIPDAPAPESGQDQVPLDR
ncbi:OmpH family outer membrane protein [Loktanella sp. DJP18]|uniref:OmpH family outer membrane protein n=1 Tax=Loktanella sp. DJP18 TaxID=3409788 RepID=UPI003BB6CA11